MIGVNSLSGGRTSSYMAVHYPSDYNIFALVCIDSIKSAPKDKLIIRAVNDKLNKHDYIDKFGEFIATAEDDMTLKVILDLEQKIGKEITWVRGDSFDDVIKSHGNVVPNMARRFCTSDMKVRPIAEFVYHNVMPLNEGMPVFSNIGFRYDERKRAKNGVDREIRQDIVVGKRKTRNKWANILWGIANYPLIYDQVDLNDVLSYWDSSPDVKFPNDSNCVGCFWKSITKLRNNYDENREKMEWFISVEKNSAYNWKSNFPYDKIPDIGKQADMFSCVGSGCNSGYCTD